MEDAVYSQRDKELSRNKQNRKIAFAAGIAGTFALGALIGAQFATQDNTASSEALLNLQLETNTGVQLVCQDILTSGEMRTNQHQWCANITGSQSSKGIGTVSSGYCNGTGDQLYQYCQDGTLRQVEQGTCLSTDGNKVEFTTCASGNAMQWKLDSAGTWSTNGVTQKLYQVKNANGQCMVASSTSSGSGAFGMGSCSNSEAKFYIQNNGSMIASGELRNVQTNECIQTNTRNNMTEDTPLLVNNEVCSAVGDQSWAWYDNGWMVNQGTNWCLEAELSDGTGDVATYPCTGADNQLWESSMYDLATNTYVFSNKASSKCLAFGSSGNPLITKCENNDYQQFAMDAPGEGTFGSATGVWTNDHCNMSGSVSMSVSQSFTYSKSVTNTVTTGFSLAVKAGIGFDSVTTTVSVSDAISSQFQATVQETETYNYSCQYYADTGKPFTTGCIWQAVVQATDSTTNVPLVFSTSYVACTESSSPPQCPPMMTCNDDSCSECVNMA